MEDHPPIVKSRSCTDIPCLIVFIGFVIGWIVVAGIAMHDGSLYRLFHPSDSHGRLCGVDDEVKDKPYLLFFDLTKCASASSAVLGCETPQLCVEECPDSYFFGVIPPIPNLGFSLGNFSIPSLDDVVEGELRSRLRYCLPHVNMSLPYDTLVDGYHCAPWHVPSGPLAGRCVPLQISTAANQLTNMSQELFTEVFRSSRSQPDEESATTVVTPPPPPEQAQTSDGTSITESVLAAGAEAVSQMRYIASHFSKITSSSLGIPLVLSLLFLLLLRFFVGPAIWLSLIGLCLAFVGLTAFCAQQYVTYSHLQDVRHRQETHREPNVTSEDAALTRLPAQLVHRPEFWLGATLVSGLLTLLAVVVVIALRKRIRLAVALLKHCSTALGDMITLPCVPLFSFALQLLVTTFFVLVSMFLFSTVHAWRVEGPCDCEMSPEGHACYPGEFENHCAEQCPQARCVTTQKLYIYAYNITALIWGTCFAKAVDQIGVALAFVTWYFSENKRLSCRLPVRSYLTAFAFHSGTAAFGSLIITICRLLRYAIEAALRWTRKHGGCLGKCVSCCCSCCFCLLERCIKFINKRAYIVTALDSVGFCTAGRRGMAVVLRNIARVAVADSVTAVCLLLGRILVVIGSVVLVRLVLSSSDSEPVPCILPTVFAAVVAYIVAGTVFTIYSMGVDTLFYCAMVDLDTNDGSAGRPYMMSTSLAKALGVRNQPAQRGGKPAESPTSAATIQSGGTRRDPPSKVIKLPGQIE